MINNKIEKPIPNADLQAYALKQQISNIINSSELSIVRLSEIFSFIATELNVRAEKQLHTDMDEFQRKINEYETNIKGKKEEQ